MRPTPLPWPPTLVELRRGELQEAAQSGHIVQVGADGRVEHFIGDPDIPTIFRSAVKPFTLAAAVASGAADAFGLTDAELAIMAASHAGRDDQVDLVRSIARKAGVDLGELACGTEEPTDPETQERLIREGVELEPVQHMCSGFHMQSLVLARHRGWPTADYWRPEHPTQRAALEVVAAVLGREQDTIRTAWDDCGVLTYELSMTEMARAFLLLADPEAPAAPPALAPYAAALRRVRDAMLAHPDLINGMPPGSEDNVDTDLMRARPGCIVAKEGSGGMLGIALLPGWAGEERGAAGVAIAIEGGDPKRVATGPAAVEALRQIGALDDAACERLSSTHVLRSTGPRGDVIAENVAVFTLQPARDGVSTG